MHFISPVFDLYSDYLLVNQGQRTATGLAALVEGELSHDANTRSLHQLRYGSAHLWQVVKPFVEHLTVPDAVLTLDDTVEAKPCMDANPLIRFHYDQCLTGGKLKLDLNPKPHEEVFVSGDWVTPFKEWLGKQTQ